MTPYSARRSSLRPSRALLAVLLLAGVAAALLMARRTPSEQTLTATVRRGALAARLTTTGTLRPVESLTYRSPVPGRDVEILELVPEGSKVAPGDLLARLDTTEVEREMARTRDDLRQAQIDLEIAEGELDEAQAQVTAVRDGDGALTVAESVSRLQLAERREGRLREEYEQLKPLLARGFITREELGRTASEFEQAQEELALARKRADVVQQLSHPREQRKAALGLAQKESQRLRARARVQETAQRLSQLGDIVDACTIHARGPGLAVYEDYLSANPRRKVRIGDRVTSSQGIVTIPEVARMVIEASVSEAEVHRVVQGQRTAVHVEAFPGVALSGLVTRIGTLASASPFRPQQDKRFAVVIALDTAPVDLRPDMSARADILVAERANTLLIPVNAVFDEGGAFVAHRIGRAGVETRALVLGESNDQLVEVLSGLDERDAVLLATPGARAAGATPSLPTGLTGAGLLAPH